MTRARTTHGIILMLLYALVGTTWGVPDKRDWLAIASIPS
jgi:hypothetical protein